MSRKTIIYLVRHGQSEANRDHIVSGHLDTPLSEEGKRQAAKTKQNLSRITFDKIYSSDLRRAIQTAEIISGRPVPKNQRLFGLRERTFGKLEGGPGTVLSEIYRNRHEEYAAKNSQNRWKFKFIPDMDSNAELSERFMRTLQQIVLSNPGKTILVSTHGGSIRTTLVKLGYATDLELPGGSFTNAGHVELFYENGVFSLGEVVGVKKLK